MATKQKPVFPCSAPPTDPATCRLLGLYPQRQQSLWMQRIKILGGALSSAQWSGLAEAAQLYTPSAPLHLTARQDIEFHNLTAEKIPPLQSAVARLGLTGLGACGDTLRNITLCHGNGLCENTPDLAGTAWIVRNLLESHPDILTLPRKFKISFSACTQACAQPWINDLAFIAEQRHGELYMKVIGAGSLGPRPATGIIIEEALPFRNILALTIAAVRLFNVHGDRKNRSKARLRHVRQRVGDKEFLAMFKEEFKQSKTENLPPIPPINFSERSYQALGQCSFPYGAIVPEQAEAIAALLRQQDIVARIQNHHRVALFAQNRDLALKKIDAIPLLKNLLGGPNIAACPGSTYCARSLVNTHTVESALRKSLPKSGPCAIRISGCPNNCAQSAVAEVGLIGRVRKKNSSSKIEGFQILKGGGMGRTSLLAQPYEQFVPSDKILEWFSSLSFDTLETPCPKGSLV